MQDVGRESSEGGQYVASREHRRSPKGSDKNQNPNESNRAHRIPLFGSRTNPLDSL